MNNTHHALTPDEIAEHAILALEHNSDMDVDPRWKPRLANLIIEAKAHAEADKMTRMAWLDQPTQHPVNHDLEVTNGECLQLFGLVVTWNTGPLWDRIRYGLVK